MVRRSKRNGAGTSVALFLAMWWDEMVLVGLAAAAAWSAWRASKDRVQQ